MEAAVDSEVNAVIEELTSEIFAGTKAAPTKIHGSTANKGNLTRRPRKRF